MLKTFWTVQTKEAFELAKNTGFLEGKEGYVWDEFRESYRWMMAQMAKRIPNYAGGYPIWFWTKKPDLRHNGHLTKGIEGVRLSVELDESDVLLSDFDAWHFVLNDQFLSFSEEEEGMFHKGTSPITKEESWERIFDLRRLMQLPDWNSELTLQGVAEKIRLCDIKHVDYFIAK